MPDETEIDSDEDVNDSWKIEIKVQRYMDWWSQLTPKQLEEMQEQELYDPELHAKSWEYFMR